MHSFTVEIPRNQMLLIDTLADPLFSCVYRNGNFTTNFAIDLDNDESVVFHYYTFIRHRSRYVVDITSAVQLALQGEADVRGE